MAIVSLVMVFLLATDFIIQLSEEINSQAQRSIIEIIFDLLTKLDERALNFIEPSLIVGCALTILFLRNANSLDLLRMLGWSPQRIVIYVCSLPCLLSTLWIISNNDAFETPEFDNGSIQYIDENQILIRFNPNAQSVKYQLLAEGGVSRLLIDTLDDQQIEKTQNASNILALSRNNLEQQINMLIPITSFLIIYFIGSISFVSLRSISTGKMVSISLGAAFAITLFKNLSVSMAIILNLSPLIFIGTLMAGIFFYALSRFKSL